MKKRLLISFGIVLMLLGCSKSEDEPAEETIKLNISSSTSTIESLGGQITISIESNTEWKIKYDKSICDIDIDTGFGNSEKIITINENTSYDSRDILISTSATQDVKISKKVIITQAGKEYINVENISLSEKEITLKSNETHKQIVYFVPEMASNKNIIWNSIDTSIATVDSDGTIRAENSGVTKIIAQSEENSEVKDSIEVTVFNPVESISIKGLYLPNPNPDIENQFAQFNYEDIKLSYEDQLKIKVNFMPGNATNKNLTWESSDTKLAIVDNSGFFSITSNMNMKGNVNIIATSEDGGHTTMVKIKVDDVFLKAQGLSWSQVGTSNIVSFISRIATSMNKNISIESVFLVNQNNVLIQIVSDITDSGSTIIAKSDQIDVGYLGLNGQSLLNELSTWKFVYTYRITGQSEYSTKEVNINASFWGSVI
tara:strand:- start:8139 stop:9425 length:1287 start_codon:yes stop_codon:yes gene_type:complete